MGASEPLTVAFVNSTRKWGGVKTWTLDFGEALQERGHRIVAVVRGGTPFELACREVGFAVYPFSFGPKYNPFAIARMVRILRKEAPDVVVANISKDLEVGAVAARLCAIPVVHRVGLVEDYKGTVEERLRHRLLVTRILVPSEYLRDGLLSRFSWLRRGEVAMLPNSKRLDRFLLGDGSGTGETVFGVTSQLSPSKGHTYLLQALQALRHSGARVRLRIAGTGALAGPLKEESERRGLSEAVEFCGFQRDIPAFLRGLDAYVLPSLNESFSNAVLEAMATGLPVVAFAAGGVPEVVGDAGILTPAADTKKLAEALGGLAASTGLRAELGRAARRRVEEHFDLARNAVLLEDLLRQVAGS